MNYTKATNFATKDSLLTGDPRKLIKGSEINAEFDAIATAISTKENTIPRGVIVAWSGAISAIPASWALCDGTNGTPDLRNRFVAGAGGDYVVGATGGANTATTATGGSILTTSTNGAHSHGGSTAGHVLTIAQIPPHTHGIASGNVAEAGSWQKTTANNSSTQQTASTGGGQAHSHGLSTDGGHAHTVDTAHTHTVDTRSPYMALAYIMKL